MPRSKGISSQCWCFTIFKENENDPLLTWDGIDNLPDKCQYVCYQLEKAKKTGKLHYQGYLQLYNGCQMSFKAIKKRLNCNWAHLEPAYGSDVDNFNYCSKFDTSINNTFKEFGNKISHQGHRSDWEAINELIKNGSDVNDILDLYPKKIPYISAIERRIYYFRKKLLKNRKFTKPEVIVLYGDAGEGKTSQIYENEDEGTVYPLETDDNKLWFDGYDNEKTLLLDDFYGNIKYSKLLRLLDGYAQRLEIKGGFVYKNWDKIYITSNQPPNEWYTFGYTKALKRRITSVFKVENGVNTPFTPNIENPNKFIPL